MSIARSRLKTCKEVIKIPFTKITHGKNVGKYKSSSGKVWTPKQIKLYWATDKFKRKPRQR